jgi:hypothetical protein
MIIWLTVIGIIGTGDSVLLGYDGGSVDDLILKEK